MDGLIEGMNLAIDHSMELVVFGCLKAFELNGDRSNSALDGELDLRLLDLDDEGVVLSFGASGDLDAECISRQGLS